MIPDNFVNKSFDRFNILILKTKKKNLFYLFIYLYSKGILILVIKKDKPTTIQNIQFIIND